MNSKIYIRIVPVLLGALLLGCGEPDHPPEVILSGSIEGEQAAAHRDNPILVAVMPYDETMQLSIYALNDVAALVSVDKHDLTFEIDLSEFGLWPGDRVNIIAFVDANAAGQFPNPDPGDYLGFYLDNGTPDTGEYLGFSGNRIPFTQFYLPRAFDVENGVNEPAYPVIFNGNTF